MTTSDVIVFAGSYAAADRPGIGAFRLDAHSFAMERVGGWSGIANPSFLVLSEGADRLYAVSETGIADGNPGRVHDLAVEWQDGTPDLTPAGDVPSGGDSPCHLGLAPGGAWLAVSNYGSGTVCVLDVDGDGRLGEIRASARFSGGSVHPDRQLAAHTHSATPTPDGRFLLVADLGGDRFVSMRLHDRDLVECGAATVRPGAGPRHTAVRSADRIVVVANELDSTLSTHRLGDSGELTLVDVASTVPDGAPPNLVAEVQLAPDGGSVVVSNRGHDSVACFPLHDDGRLGERRIRPSGGSWPRHFALLPDGRHLVVANERSDELVVLSVDGGEPVARVAMPSPTCVVVHRG